MREYRPVTRSKSEYRLLLFAGLLVLLAITTIYLPVASFEFLAFDDGHYVLRNPDIQGGLTVESVRAVFTRSYVSSWHPLAMFSHALDVSLFGMNPGPHHVVNVLFHAVNALLVLLVWHRLTGRPVESALLALLWAVHPQHVEPVAWISSRKDLLSTLFMLLCLLAYHGYVVRGGVLRYAAVALTLALGLLAKPMLVTLPFVLLLLDLWPLNRIDTPKRAVRCALEKIPLLAIAAVFMVVTQWVQTEGGAVKSLDDLPLQARLANIPVAYAAYVAKTFWPADLSVFYPHPLGGDPAWKVAASTAFILALSLAAVTQWRRRPYLFAGWFWFAGTLVPVIGLVQFGWHGMADRYTYVAHLGLFTAVIWFGSELVRRAPAWRAPALALAAAACIAATAASARYVHVFENDIRLFSHVLDTTGPSRVQVVNLGTGLLEHGAPAEALRVFESGHDLEPDYTNLFNNIGVCYIQLGRLDLALEAFREGLRRMPDDDFAEHNVEFAEGNLAKLATQIEELEARVNANPQDHAAVHQLAGLWFRVGRLSEAERAYTFLAEEYPETPELPLRLAEIHAWNKRRDEAISQYERARSLGADPLDFLYPLGVLLEDAGRHEEALGCFEVASRLTPPSYGALYRLDRIRRHSAR